MLASNLRTPPPRQCAWKWAITAKQEGSSKLGSYLQLIELTEKCHFACL